MMSIDFYTHMNHDPPILDEKISLKNDKNVDFGQKTPKVACQGGNKRQGYNLTELILYLRRLLI
jgi:hypothetical protein